MSTLKTASKMLKVTKYEESRCYKLNLRYAIFPSLYSDIELNRRPQEHQIFYENMNSFTYLIYRLYVFKFANFQIPLFM